jgi:hypothetical protein
MYNVCMYATSPWVLRIRIQQKYWIRIQWIRSHNTIRDTTHVQLLGNITTQRSVVTIYQQQTTAAAIKVKNMTICEKLYKFGLKHIFMMRHLKPWLTKIIQMHFQTFHISTRLVEKHIPMKTSLRERIEILSKAKARSICEGCLRQMESPSP